MQKRATGYVRRTANAFVSDFGRIPTEAELLSCRIEFVSRSTMRVAIAFAISCIIGGEIAIYALGSKKGQTFLIFGLVFLYGLWGTKMTRVSDYIDSLPPEISTGVLPAVFEDANESLNATQGQPSPPPVARLRPRHSPDRRSPS